MHNQALSYIINDFVTLLLICSPLSALPALLGLTLGRSDKEKRRTGIVASAAMGLILLVVTWIGSPLLSFLGIGVPSFQIAGGIVIFTLAMSMLNAQQSRMKQAEEPLRIGAKTLGRDRTARHPIDGRPRSDRVR